MAVQVMCGWWKWLLLLALITASSCRSWEDPATAENASQLKAIYDGRHHFALAYDSQSSLWRFEVCEIRRAGDPKQNVCVNAFRLRDGRPMSFDAARLEGSQMSSGTLARLKEQQRLIVEYSDIGKSRDYLGASGIATIGLGVMRLGKASLAAAAVGGRAGLIMAAQGVMLISVGGVILGFRSHEDEHAADLALKLKNVPAPQLFYKPKKWAVAFHNWPGITSQDPEVSVKISSVKDHLEVIALLLNRIHAQQGYFISQYCIPQGSEAQCFGLPGTPS